MPTIVYDGPYAFRFWSIDIHDRRAHIHVERDRNSVNVWLEPQVELADTRKKRSGFTAKELRTIEGLVQKHREVLLEPWNEHFRDFE